MISFDIWFPFRYLPNVSNLSRLPKLSMPLLIHHGNSLPLPVQSLSFESSGKEGKGEEDHG